MDPVLIEIDEQSWAGSLDRVAAWLGDLQLMQATFRQLAETTAGKIAEPHIRDYLSGIAEQAREHEQRIADLYRLIDRHPSTVRPVIGSVMGRAREVLGVVQGVAGGAVGNWNDLRQLLAANLNAMGAFAITEQLGLALGIDEIVDITFQVTQEKSTCQLLLQEYVLELAPRSILYRTSV